MDGPMSTVAGKTMEQEHDLGAIISAYNQVSGSLKESHDKLSREVRGLREELKRKNEQLRRRERLAALGEMAAGLAHEIRNPLSAIQLLAALLKRNVADRPDALQLLEKIVSSADTMEAIVADVLTFGRPRDPHPAPIELENLLKETVQLASAKIAKTNVDVEISRYFDGEELVTDGIMLVTLGVVILATLSTEFHGSTRTPRRLTLSDFISLAIIVPAILLGVTEMSGIGYPQEASGVVGMLHIILAVVMLFSVATEG